MSRAETVFAICRVAVRAPAHVMAAIAQAWDYIEHDVRQHVFAEPTVDDTMQSSILREAAEIRETGNDHAPVNIRDIA